MPRAVMTCGLTPVISFPWNVTPPRRGLSSPEIVRSVVVFPAPFAPISVTISPCSTSIEMPCSAVIAP